VLCLGYTDHFYSAPMLQLEGWREPRPLDELLSENLWPDNDA